jgi:hypothetical protein
MMHSGHMCRYGASVLDAGPGGIFTDSDAADSFDGLILDAQMNNECNTAGLQPQACILYV